MLDFAGGGGAGKCIEIGRRLATGLSGFLASVSDATSDFGAIIEEGLGLVLVERAKVLVDFASGFAVFTDVDRAKELILLDVAAVGARVLEIAEG